MPTALRIRRCGLATAIPIDDRGLRPLEPPRAGDPPQRRAGNSREEVGTGWVKFRSSDGSVFDCRSHGGTTAAIYFSLIETCKARGIDPKIYLHDVMLRLAEGADAKTLTPKKWQARHASEVAERRNYVLAKIVAKLAGAPK